MKVMSVSRLLLILVGFLLLLPYSTVLMFQTLGAAVAIATGLLVGFVLWTTLKRGRVSL